ncbi:MAG: GIY-YIG nuclease family protein [Actinomycetota bacterium]
MDEKTTETQHIIKIEWMKAGNVALAGKEYELRFDPNVPDRGGVYQLISHDSREIYVGESKNLLRRMRDYAKAGWRPERKAATNRTVQGWIYNTLKDGISTVELIICTRAWFETNDGHHAAINLASKHERRTVEGLTILSVQEGYKLKNK